VEPMVRESALEEELTDPGSSVNTNGNFGERHHLFDVWPGGTPECTLRACAALTLAALARR
jgi:hypothetical protein